MTQGKERTGISKKVAISLRAVRAARDFTQMQLARKTGIPQTRICLIEKARVAATPKELAKLWGALTTE
jgi:predicted transcriptional regulator